MLRRRRCLAVFQPRVAPAPFADACSYANFHAHVLLSHASSLHFLMFQLRRDPSLQLMRTLNEKLLLMTPKQSPHAQLFPIPNDPKDRVHLFS